MKEDPTKDPNAEINRVARLYKRFEAANQIDGPRRVNETHAVAEEALELAETMAKDLESILKRIGKTGQNIEGVGPVTAVCGLALDFEDAREMVESLRLKAELIQKGII